MTKKDNVSLIMLYKDLKTRIGKIHFSDKLRTRDNSLLIDIMAVDLEKLKKYIILGVGHTGKKSLNKDDEGIMIQNIKTEEVFWFHFTKEMQEVTLDLIETRLKEE